MIHVRVHQSVRVIRARAFYRRSLLISVELNNGIEVIEEDVFRECRSLREILFPPSIRAIKNFAFFNCSVLTTAILNDGLEEIGKWAFAQCGLVRINIPPSVKEIDERAFEYCSNLLTVRFCAEIEEFVSAESMRHWWNNGVHGKCLSTYCFFVRCNIPERAGLVRSTTLQTNIHGMLEHIPSPYPKSLNAHFCSIDSKLSAYEAKLSAYEGSTMLELAIWKSEIAEQTDRAIYLLNDDSKMSCCIDSLSMVDIIVPNVLSFLRGDDDGDDDDSDEDDGDGDDEY